MSAGVVRTAFRDHLAASIVLNSVSAPYIETLNSTTDTADRPDEWCTLDFAGAEEEPISLGNAPGDRAFRETGTVFAHAMAEANKGDDRAVEIADEIRAAFRDVNLGVGIQVETVSPPDTGEGKPDGRVFRAIVEITYRFDFTA
ncbi:MAG: hypothetical protein AAGC81_02380 [Pseudomonadota bacterium]